MNKNNNFDFLRFLFALLVVVSHSYPLSRSKESSQWIYQITNGQIVWAQIGLSGFFIVSGYFIFQSLQRSKNLIDYFKKRFLRLFPALLVVLVLSIILAPLVYEGAVPYWGNKEVYTYLPNNISLYNFQSGIKGIFDKNYYHAINGSLWTIRYEFSMYIALSLLFFFRKNKVLVQVLLSIMFVVFYLSYNFFLDRIGGSKIFGMQGLHILNLGTFFVCGSFLASLQLEQIKNKGFIILGFILIGVASIYFNYYDSVKHFILPVIILVFGFIPLPFFSTFGKIGDMSYGIYIYSFPIQQTLMYFFKWNTYELMIDSVILSIGFGFLSWHLIEKTALKYKKNTFFKTQLLNNQKS